MSASRSNSRFASLQLEPLEDRAVPAAVVATYSDGIALYAWWNGWVEETIANPDEVDAESVAEDIAVANDGQTILADFGSEGLYRYTDAEGWDQLTDLDAQQIALSDTGTVVAAFGNQTGIWVWNPGVGWGQITPVDPENFAISASGILAGDFGSFGVWRWSSFYGWQQLTTVNPEEVAIMDDGSVVGDFGLGGTWYFNSFLGWSQIGASNPSQLAGASAAVYSSYTFGLFGHSPYYGWFGVNPSVPTAFEAADYFELGLDYGSDGLWYFSLYTGFLQLSEDDPVSIAIG